MSIYTVLHRWCLYRHFYHKVAFYSVVQPFWIMYSTVKQIPRCGCITAAAALPAITAAISTDLSEMFVLHGSVGVVVAD